MSSRRSSCYGTEVKKLTAMAVRFLQRLGFNPWIPCCHSCGIGQIHSLAQELPFVLDVDILKKKKKKKKNEQQEFLLWWSGLKIWLFLWCPTCGVGCSFNSDLTPGLGTICLTGATEKEGGKKMSD